MVKHISIRLKLFILVFMVLIPLILLQLYRINSAYNDKIESELDACRDLAGAISTMLLSYVDEIWTQEMVIGSYFMYHPELSHDEIQTFLNDAQSKSSTLKRINWINTYGIVINSTNTELIGATLTERKYVQRVFDGEEKVVSDLVVGKIDGGKPVIPVAVAVKRDGILIGIISAVIDVDKLALRLPKARVSQKSIIGLVDTQGKLIYSSDEKDISLNESIYSDNLHVWNYLKEGEVVRSFEKASFEEGSTIMGISYSIKELGLNCIITTPYAQLMKTHYRTLWRDILILCFISLASILVAILIGNRILIPLANLRNSAQKLMSGDFTVRTNITGYDEIATTALAFDRMAEGINEYDKLKSQVFTNLSYELKTPLNVIYSSLQLISKIPSSIDYDVFRNKVEKQTRIMRQNSYRLMRIINNLIDITRCDNGFMNIKLANYDIVKVVEEITLSVVKYAESKDITVLFDTEIEEKVIACDPDMIERIMLNLISNALKFTDVNGNIYVKVYEQQGFVILSVKDTGIGIPKVKSDMIFERFGQVDDSLKRNQEGSGIGLSLVKALVEAHNGTISVQSEIGEGAEFIIKIPGNILPETHNDCKSSNDYSKQSLVERINIEFSDIYL